MEKKKKLLLVVASALVVTGAYAQLVPGYDNMGNDINECIDGTHHCPPCMICENAEGTYYCFPGYEPCEGDHEHISGGGQALPKPDPELLPNKFLDPTKYEYDGGGVEVDAGGLGFDVRFKFDKGTKILGAAIYYCDFGGDVACVRGIRGIFTTTTGITTQFLPL